MAIILLEPWSDTNIVLVLLFSLSLFLLLLITAIPNGEEVNKAVLKQFIKIVESQTKFNKNGQINTIPIIGYHKIDVGKDYYTSPQLFEQEMEYLYENGFKVITLADLGYDENKQKFYLKNDNNIGSDLSQFQKSQIK